MSNLKLWVCTVVYSTAFCLPAQSQITTDNLNQVVSLKTLDEEAWDIVTRPDGRRIAFVRWRKPVKILGRNAVMPYQEIGHQETVEFAFSSNPDIVAYSAFRGEGVFLANLKTKKETILDAGTGQVHVRFSPDGQLLATGKYGTKAKLWNVKTGKLMREIEMGSTKGELSPEFSPNGKVLAIGHRNSKPRLFDVKTGKLLHVLNKTMSKELAFHPNGKTLAIGFTDGTVTTWNVETGKLMREVNSDAEDVFSLCWSPDGRLLATAGLHGSVTIWSPEKLKQLKNLKIPSQRVFSLSFSPDGEVLFAGGNVVDGSQERKIWRWGLKQSK